MTLVQIFFPHPLGTYVKCYLFTIANTWLPSEHSQTLVDCILIFDIVAAVCVITNKVIRLRADSVDLLRLVSGRSNNLDKAQITTTKE